MTICEPASRDVGPTRRPPQLLVCTHQFITRRIRLIGSGPVSQASRPSRIIDGLGEPLATVHQASTRSMDGSDGLAQTSLHHRLLIAWPSDWSRTPPSSSACGMPAASACTGPGCPSLWLASQTGLAARMQCNSRRGRTTMSCRMPFLSLTPPAVCCATDYTTTCRRLQSLSRPRREPARVTQAEGVDRQRHHAPQTRLATHRRPCCG